MKLLLKRVIPRLPLGSSVYVNNKWDLAADKSCPAPCILLHFFYYFFFRMLKGAFKYQAMLL